MRACPKCESPREVVCSCQKDATFTAEDSPGKIKGIVKNAVMITILWTCTCGYKNCRERRVNSKGDYEVRCLGCSTRFVVKVKG